MHDNNCLAKLSSAFVISRETPRIIFGHCTTAPFLSVGVNYGPRMFEELQMRLTV